MTEEQMKETLKKSFLNGTLGKLWEVLYQAIEELDDIYYQTDEYDGWLDGIRDTLEIFQGDIATIQEELEV